MSFGFSAGDFLALSQLIFSVTKALSDGAGSKAEYQSLIQELLSLLRTINAAEETALRCSLDSNLSRDASFLAPLNAIAREREICHKLIEDFMSKSEKYTASFIHGTGRAKAIKKLTWRLFHSEDVLELERKLRVHSDAIQFYNCSLGFQSLNARLASNALVLTQIDSRTTMIYEMINQLFNIMPKALGYTWEGGCMLEEKPLRLLDALGRDLTIPAVFLTSPEVFHDMLEIIHRNLPGHRKIKSKEYSIADEDAEGQIIETVKDVHWSKAVRSGKTVSVNMVFQTFSHNKNSEKCPRCRSATSGPTLEGKRRRCQVCQLTFNIFEEVRFEEVKSPSNSPSQPRVTDFEGTDTKSNKSSSQKRRQPKAVAKDRKEREQDIFRRIHYIHELVKRKTLDLATTKKFQSGTDHDNYMKDLPPLHHAAAFGDLEKVRTLLNDINNDIESKGGCDDATALHYAAYQGRQDVAIFLIERGAIVESRDCDGATPLHWSVPFGHMSMFKLLLESGADINSRTNKGRTTLHWCGWKNQPIMAKFIIEEGVEVDALDTDGMEPLSHCEGDSSELIRLLVDEGADIHSESAIKMTPLHYMAATCSIEALKTMLDLGADIYALDEYSRTPFYIAMAREEDAIEVCRFLIDNGADIIGSNDEMANRLLQAIRYPKILKLLLDSGVDVDSRGQMGRTALHLALLSEQTDSFRYLLQSNADVNAKDDSGNTALHFALNSNSVEHLSELLVSGAEIDENDKGETPLHQVTANTPGEAVRLLVAHGVDVAAKSVGGDSLLQKAAEVGNAECIRALIELGADPSEENENKASPIHEAAIQGHVAAVQAFLDAGVDVDYPWDINGGTITSLHAAAYENKHKVITLLLQAGADPLASGDAYGIPLHLAARNGAVESAQILLAHNTAEEQVISATVSDMTPLALAASLGKLDMVKMLVEHPANTLPIEINDILPHSQDEKFSDDLRQWFSDRLNSPGAK